MQKLSDVFQQIYDVGGVNGLLSESLPDELLREIMLDPGQNAETLAELRGLPVLEILKELRAEAIKRNRDEAQRLIDIEKN